MGQLYLHCSLIYFVPSSCFCIVIAFRWNNPNAAFASRGGDIHAGGGGFTHWLTDCFWCKPTTTSGNIITQSIIFSFSISLNSSCILHHSNITLTHLHVSNCRCSPASVLWHFCRAAVGNGVITVMINSPWQADDDADNQSGDNRGDSTHTSISLTVPARFWILQSGYQLGGLSGP